MKFYNRESELEILKKADSLKYKRSILSIIVGRRRVGKTTLALKVKEDSLYFFVSKKSEALLCEEFCEELQKNGFKIYGKFEKFGELFEYIVDLSKTKPITLIIDEFQNFYKINPSIFSSLQKIWDLNKNTAHLHLIICGSVYSLMKKIFEDSKEPLFGRADFKIKLKELNVKVLKQILEDYNAFNSKNLLDLYTITGGLAKYIELLVLYEAFDLKSMIEKIISPYSLFLDEGKNRLIEEFGKDYSVYFSILSLIASSKTSRSEIESVLQKNISGYLERLEKDYNIIKPVKPINAKPNSKLQKYEIIDNFLNFWFRFIYKYQSLIEAENFEALKEIIIRDFSTYQGKFLEKLFVDILKLQQKWTKIGRYWERGNKNEIDIVAIDEKNKKILFAEVKFNKKRANLNELILKSRKLTEQYNAFKTDYKILSVEDVGEMLKR
ncbi:ATP-binding protein [Deferribacter abyssi]|uniref:ATP-binding protein n=1 Tax=Deferribacter abyssi TaxID=213806 RepID=UPI003C16D8E2